MNTPTDTINNRGSYYAAAEYGKVYDLYSLRSELRQFFTDKALYVEHVENIQCKESCFISLNVLQEKQRGKIAEVRFIEHFTQGDKLDEYIKYFTIATLVQEHGEWHILKEIREILVEE